MRDSDKSRGKKVNASPVDDLIVGTKSVCVSMCLMSVSVCAVYISLSECACVCVGVCGGCTTVTHAHGRGCDLTAADRQV